MAYQCSTCKKVFTHEAGARQHIASVHTKRGGDVVPASWPRRDDGKETEWERYARDHQGMP